MKEQLSALYELQTIDVEITRAKAHLARLTGGAEIKRGIAAAKSALEAAEKTLAEHEIELKDAELKLKSIDDKRGGFEKRLYGGAVGNPKELASIEKEIGILKQQQSQLDGRVLELYDSVEDAREKARSARKSADELEKRLHDVLAKEASEKSRLEAEIAQMTLQRGDAAARVANKPLMSRYEAVRKHSGVTGIAKVVDGKCEGCRVQVTPFIVGKLVTGIGWQCCESCGRILLLDIK